MGGARHKTGKQLTNKVPLVKFKSTNNHATDVTQLQSVVNVVLWFLVRYEEPVSCFTGRLVIRFR